MKNPSVSTDTCAAPGLIRLFIWDGRESCAEEICIERNPVCPVCGMKKTNSQKKRKP